MALLLDTRVGPTVSPLIKGLSGSSAPFQPLMTLEHPDSVLCVVSIDEATIATGCQDSNIRIWDANTFCVVRTLTGHTRCILSLAVHAGILCSSSSDRTIRLWSVADNFQCIGCYYCFAGHAISLCAGTPQAAQDEKVIEMWAGSQNAHISRRKVRIDSESMDSPGSELAVAIPTPPLITQSSGESQDAGESASVQLPSLWATSAAARQAITRERSAATAEEANKWDTLAGHTGNVYTLRVATLPVEAVPSWNLPEGTDHVRVLCSGGGDGEVRLWWCDDVCRGNERVRGGRGKGEGRRGECSRVRWAERERDMGECIGCLEGHTGSVYALTTYKAELYSGSQDTTIRVWDLDSHNCKHILTGHSDDVMSLCIVESGAGVCASALISACADGTLRIWSTDTYQCLQEVSHHNGIVHCVCELEGVIYTSGSDNCVKAVELEDLCPYLSEGSTIQPTSFGEETDSTASPHITPSVLPVLSSLTPQTSLSSLSRLPLHMQQNRSAMENRMLSCLRQFVSIRTVSSEPSLARECWRGAKYLFSLFQHFTNDTRLVQTSSKGLPIVLARMGWREDVPTLTFHAHYDVVSATEGSPDWHSPPYTLTGRDGYLYGRGVSDNKGPLLACIHAAAHARAVTDGGVNVVFVVEGEGEVGSQGFEDVVASNLSWFKGTCMILQSNSTWLGETRPCLTYGTRGRIELEVKVEGAALDVHAGQDGGVIHEPVMELIHILSTLHDPVSGVIRVPGMYDGLPEMSEEEVALYDDIDFNMKLYLSNRGLRRVQRELPPGVDMTVTRLQQRQQACTPVFSASEKGEQVGKKRGREEARGNGSAQPPAASESSAGAPEARRKVQGEDRRSEGTARDKDIPCDDVKAFLIRRWRLPALTIHHTTASTDSDSVIPRAAAACVSVRTVPPQMSDDVIARVKRHLEEAFSRLCSPNQLTVTVKSSGNWWIQDPKNAHYAAAAAAIARVWRVQPMYVREGGSIRVTQTLEKLLRVPAVQLPLGQSSDSAHLPNERIRLINLKHGMRVFTELFLSYARQSSQTNNSTD